MFTNNIYLIYIYQPDLVLNNQQWLICYKTQPNQLAFMIASFGSEILHAKTSDMWPGDISMEYFCKF